MAFLGKIGKVLGLGSTSQVLGSVAGPLVDFGMGLVQNNQQSNAAKDAGYANADLQREFAQNSISWKIDDAARRGIHPLAALGVQPYSASPAFMAGSSPSLPSMGQNIGNAVQRTLDRNQRAQSSAMDALQLENASLQNDYLRAQITKIQSTIAPPMFGGTGMIGAAGIPGQSSGVALNPNDITMSDAPSKDAGFHNTYSVAKGADGSYSILPGNELKQLSEDFGPLSWVHYAKMAKNPPYKPVDAPRKGYTWVYNPLTLTWSQRRKRYDLDAVKRTLLHYGSSHHKIPFKQ